MHNWKSIKSVLIKNCSSYICMRYCEQAHFNGVSQSHGNQLVQMKDELDCKCLYLGEAECLQCFIVCYVEKPV